MLLCCIVLLCIYVVSFDHVSYTVEWVLIVSVYKLQVLLHHTITIMIYMYIALGMAPYRNKQLA